MEAASTSLDDRIYTPCLLCGGSDFAIIAVPSDIAFQQCYLQQFHRSRLIESLSAEARRYSLTDRVSFTHNYETYIVACRVCGLLCRNPHPPAGAVTEAYAALEESPQPSHAVDAVVIWNTFDQLPDPRPLLTTIAQLLKPEGLLVIRIPHGNCYRSAMELTKVHRWMRKPVYTGLAWNNLLGFPYLYGYGLTTLDCLAGEFGLFREAVYPDTLMMAAVAGVKWWVTLEERFVKRFCRWTITLDQWMGDLSLGHATWLDVYYRKPSRSLGPSKSVPGLSPVGAHCILDQTVAGRATQSSYA